MSKILNCFVQKAEFFKNHSKHWLPVKTSFRFPFKTLFSFSLKVSAWKCLTISIFLNFRGAISRPFIHACSLQKTFHRKTMRKALITTKPRTSLPPLPPPRLKVDANLYQFESDTSSRIKQFASCCWKCLTLDCFSSLSFILPSRSLIFCLRLLLVINSKVVVWCKRSIPSSNN